MSPRFALRRLLCTWCTVCTLGWISPAATAAGVLIYQPVTGSARHSVVAPILPVAPASESKRRAPKRTVPERNHADTGAESRQVTTVGRDAAMLSTERRRLSVTTLDRRLLLPPYHERPYGIRGPKLSRHTASDQRAAITRSRKVLPHFETGSARVPAPLRGIHNHP